MDIQIRNLLEHRIISGNDALNVLAEDLKNRYYVNLVIVCDTNTAEFCLPPLLQRVPVLREASVLVVPDGETSKTIDQAIRLWQELTRLNIGRYDLLINLGGGMITDLGGFVAATYLRGIPFLHVPTTLLAQVDAAIGGKTGIDFEHAKNRIGLTAFPQAVFCWPGFFDTLPAIEWESACGEVVKHAALSGIDLWQYFVEQGLSTTSVSARLNDVQEVKLKVVEQDPLEKGIRKSLNLGHTIGHAIESEFLALGSPLPHGLAVVLGMMMEAEIAAALGVLDQQSLAEIVYRLQSWFVLPDVSILQSERLISWMRMDKKNQGEEIMFSLLTGIGECKWNVAASIPVIRSVLNKYCNG